MLSRVERQRRARVRVALQAVIGIINKEVGNDGEYLDEIAKEVCVGTDITLSNTSIRSEMMRIAQQLQSRCDRIERAGDEYVREGYRRQSE